MDGFHPNLLAVLTGFISGFILSVPVGPVNLTIANEGARRGFFWAALIGFGATVMEAIYCAGAFTGFAALFEGRTIKAIMEFASLFFFFYLGIKFLIASKIAAVNPVEQKFRMIQMEPHSAFFIGVVRVFLNPGVFLFWIVLATRFRDRGWVPPNLSGSFSCVLGVAAGTSAWFCGLSYAASRGHGKFTEKALLRMEHISGICLLVVGVIEAINIVRQIVQHKL